jgi:glycosyltransferase involved in cell wall biosynthesis
MNDTGRIQVLEIIQGFAVEGPLGGIERFGIELVRALDRTPIEPILCGLWRYGTPHEEPRLARLREEGLRAFFAADWDEAHPYDSFLRARRGILQQLDGRSVHLIHSHCQFGDGLALLVARSLHAQALLRTVHNEREWPNRPGRRLFLTNLVFPLLFQREIGVSQKVVSNLDHRLIARLSGRKGLCMYNAVNLERFSVRPDASILARKRQELGLPEEAIIVGTIGRLTQQKGYSILLEAADLVLREMPAVHVVIIGEGELKDSLKELAGQLGIARSVHFTGPRNDIEELLAIMDLFASSSLWEGLPTVILESMAAQVPVVATDVSGTRELVQDEVTGLLVPAGNPALLARAIVRALRQRELTTAMVEQACSRAQDFSIAEVAKQHVKTYQRTANRV